MRRPVPQRATNVDAADEVDEVDEESAASDGGAAVTAAASGGGPTATISSTRGIRDPIRDRSNQKRGCHYILLI